jgi:regulator of protease activity HflC (stomatin/prohibitin superfamily)
MVNIKKIVGWVALAVGLMIIGQAINLSFQYFTAKQDFPAVFKLPAAIQNTAEEAKQTAVAATSAELQAQAQAQMQEAMSKATAQAVSSMVPTDVIAKLLNAIVWSMFATFLVYAGAKIAEIGVKMIG